MTATTPAQDHAPADAAAAALAAVTRRVEPLCRSCSRKPRVRANGTATKHPTRGEPCPGSGRALFLASSCGCGQDDLIGAWTSPAGRPYRRAPVSAAVCSRADHQVAVHQCVHGRAGVAPDEIGFTPTPETEKRAPWLDEGAAHARQALVATLAGPASIPPEDGERYSYAQALVLEQGRAWAPVPLGADLESHRGVVRRCYANAARMVAAVPGLVYVEGYATPSPHRAWAIPHAWVGRLSDGAALEPTWPEPGTAYYGVALTSEFVRSYPRVPGTDAVMVEALPRALRRQGLPHDAVAR
ncbi:hypothetical protein [Nocardiopsis synnemataformans]|uniref:hypothetical protein n=1 Tax=Nocardiopsis synnemataformans TaxID=61305 RepID=UPI003EBBA4AB